MALRQAPAEINIDDWNSEVKKLGLGDTSSPGLNEVRLFIENGKFYLKAWNGSEWKRINDYDSKSGEFTFEDAVRFTAGEGLSIADGGSSITTLGGHNHNDARLLRMEDQNGPDPDGIFMIGGYGPMSEIPENREFKEYICINSSYFEFKGNKVWHAGNDGSGSGLDADKLDGKEIEAGTAAGSLTGQWKTFTSAFASIPTVVVTPNDLGSGAPVVSNVTTTGFELVCPMQAVFCYYVAIGNR